MKYLKSLSVGLFVFSLFLVSVVALPNTASASAKDSCVAILAGNPSTLMRRACTNIITAYDLQTLADNSPSITESQRTSYTALISGALLEATDVLAQEIARLTATNNAPIRLVATTGDVLSLTDTTALISGSVDIQNPTPVGVYVQFGPTQTMTSNTQTILRSSGITSFNIPLSGLAPNTPYYYRVSFITDVSASNVTQGTVKTFRTQNLQVAGQVVSVTTGETTSITSSSANPLSYYTLNSGTISVYFEFSGVETNLSSQTEAFVLPNQPNNHNYQNQSPIGTGAILSGLLPNTIYYYRAVAQQADGAKIYGATRSFTTLPLPTNTLIQARPVNDLTACRVNTSSVRLNWTRDTSDTLAARYVIYRRNYVGVPQQWTGGAKPAISNLTYTDTGTQFYDENGVRLSAPTSAGTYYYTVIVESPTNDRRNSPMKQVAVTPSTPNCDGSIATNLPDLVITDITAAPLSGGANLTTLVGGVDYRFTATIKNNGTVTAPAGIYGQNSSETLPALTPGQTTTTSYTGGLTLPRLTPVCFRADITHIVSEAVETNNDFCKDFSVVATYTDEGTLTLKHWETVRLNNGLVAMADGVNTNGQTPYVIKFKLYDSNAPYVTSSSADYSPLGETPNLGISQTHTGTYGGKSFTVTVNSIDVPSGGGNATWQANVTLTSSGQTVTQPVLTSSAITNSRVDLSWTAPTGLTDTSYTVRVYRRLGDTPWGTTSSAGIVLSQTNYPFCTSGTLTPCKLDVLAPSSRVASDNYVAPGSNYQYMVQYLNSLGSPVALSNNLAVLIPAIVSGPAAPTNLTAIKYPYAERVQVSWDVVNGKVYEIQRKARGASDSTYVTVSTGVSYTGNSWTDGVALTESWTYRVRRASEGSIPESAWTVADYIAPGPVQLSAPAVSQALAGSNLNLSWQAVANATQYDVRATLTPVTGSTDPTYAELTASLQTAMSSGNQKSFPNLGTGRYVYYVVAISGNTAQYSNSTPTKVVVTIAPVVTKWPTPTNFIAEKSPSSSYVRLSWTIPNDAQYTYDLERAPANSGAWFALERPSLRTGQMWSDNTSNITESYDYRLRVAAYSGKLASDWVMASYVPPAASTPIVIATPADVSTSVKHTTTQATAAIQVQPGKSLNISATRQLALSSGGGAGLVWSSSNPSVASVNSATGLVTGASAGTATITATLGTQTASITMDIGARCTLSSGFVGQHDASPLSNTDRRFTCYNGAWYATATNWSGSGGFVSSANVRTEGQSIGSWTNTGGYFVRRSGTSASTQSQLASIISALESLKDSF